MVDSPFFGSPTKIFEYMALGGGIVASDLEQIGEVLGPALRATALTQPASSVIHERAVLCTPGDVDEFVDAVVHLIERPEIGAALGRNARQAVVDHYSWTKHVERLWAFALERRQVTARRLETGDQYKEQIQNQWNANPVGSEAARAVQPHTMEWFLEIERHRYGTYAPWMPSVMEFSDHAGEAVLEIGGGVGTDLAQFARHGARVTDLDLSHGHLQLAEENFRLRGLTGTFVHHDAEILPFEDAAFDLVYSNGVLHHTPNTARAIDEVFRVLKPGGRVVAMLYAENSLQYWRNLVWAYGVRDGQLSRASMADILSRTVERTSNESRPLTKVYTRSRVNRLFRKFTGRQILQRQLSPEIIPRPFRRLATPRCIRDADHFRVGILGYYWNHRTAAKIKQPGSATKHRAAHQRAATVGVFEIEITMATARAREARNFAAHRAHRKARQQGFGDLMQQRSDAPDRALRAFAGRVNHRQTQHWRGSRTPQPRQSRPSAACRLSRGCHSHANC